MFSDADPGSHSRGPTPAGSQSGDRLGDQGLTAKNPVPSGSGPSGGASNLAGHGHIGASAGLQAGTASGGGGSSSSALPGAMSLPDSTIGELMGSSGKPTPTCVVFIPGTDAGVVDAVLGRLRGVFPGSTLAVRATTHVHLFRPTPALTRALPEPRRLYLFELAGLAAHDRALVLPPGAGIATAAPRGHLRALISKLRNLWVPRQAAVIDGVYLDLRDFAVCLGQLFLAKALVGTIAQVTYKLDVDAAQLLQEFVRDHILPAAPRRPTVAKGSSALPGPSTSAASASPSAAPPDRALDAATAPAISPVLPDPIMCYVHVFRERGLL